MSMKIVSRTRVATRGNARMWALDPRLGVEARQPGRYVADARTRRIDEASDLVQCRQIGDLCPRCTSFSADITLKTPCAPAIADARTSASSSDPGTRSAPASRSAWRRTGRERRERANGYSARRGLPTRLGVRLPRRRPPLAAYRSMVPAGCSLCRQQTIGSPHDAVLSSGDRLTAGCALTRPIGIQSRCGCHDDKHVDKPRRPACDQACFWLVIYSPPAEPRRNAGLASRNRICMRTTHAWTARRNAGATLRDTTIQHTDRRHRRHGVAVEPHAGVRPPSS